MTYRDLVKGRIISAECLLFSINRHFIDYSIEMENPERVVSKVLLKTNLTASKNAKIKRDTKYVYITVNEFD